MPGYTRIRLTWRQNHLRYAVLVPNVCPRSYCYIPALTAEGCVTIELEDCLIHVTLISISWPCAATAIDFICFVVVVFDRKKRVFRFHVELSNAQRIPHIGKSQITCYHCESSPSQADLAIHLSLSSTTCVHSYLKSKELMHANRTPPSPSLKL